MLDRFHNRQYCDCAAAASGCRPFIHRTERYTRLGTFQGWNRFQANRATAREQCSDALSRVKQPCDTIACSSLSLAWFSLIPDIRRACLVLVIVAKHKPQLLVLRSMNWATPLAAAYQNATTIL